MQKMRRDAGPAVDRMGEVWYISNSKRGTAQPPYIGGDSVTVLETLALLNLIAVVVFGVINVTTKR